MKRTNFHLYFRAEMSIVLSTSALFGFYWKIKVIIIIPSLPNLIKNQFLRYFCRHLNHQNTCNSLEPLQTCSCLCSESQNHRIVGVGRDLCGSSSPTLLPKQGYLQQAAQDPVQAGLEYLQRRRLHNLPGQPVQGSVTLRGKKFLLMFRRNFLCFSLCPLPLVLSLGTTEKSLSPSS